MDEIAQVGDLNVHDNFVSKTVACQQHQWELFQNKFKTKNKRGAAKNAKYNKHFSDIAHGAQKLFAFIPD